MSDEFDRPLSCPADAEPWRNESEMPIDRSRSVLARQDAITIKRELSKNINKQIGASEGEFNKAKVNPWVGSEVEPNANIDNTNRKPFSSNAGTSKPHHAVKSLSESAGTRPQTEPGRSRKPLFSEDVEKLSQQSIDDVGTRPHAPGDTTEQGASEDWVVVEKLSSETMMPCDPDDESNVLVPSTNAASTAREQDGPSSDSLERTRVVTTNELGSAFQVLPQIPDRVEGADGLAALEKKDTKSSSQKARSNVSFSGIGTFAATIIKWKARRGTAEANRLRLGYKSLDKEHQEILAIEANTIKTEVPEGLMRTIKEEAYKVVLKTTQAYRSQIGARHKLTTDAFEYLKELQDELQRS